MPRKQRPQICACGCRQKTRDGAFMPGHAQKLLGACAEHFGGIEELRDFIEKRTKRKVRVPR